MEVQELLLPVLDACADQRTAATLITADAGYHSEANLAALAEQHIDALIADNAMRRRDERFAEQDKHLAKPDPLHDKTARLPGSGEGGGAAMRRTARNTTGNTGSTANCMASQAIEWQAAHHG